MLDGVRGLRRQISFVLYFGQNKYQLIPIKMKDEHISKCLKSFML